LQARLFDPVYRSNPLVKIRSSEVSQLTPTATITSLVGFLSGWASADGDELDDHVKGKFANNGSGTLIVRAQGLDSSDGNLCFVLFNSKKNFLKSPTRAEIIEIENKQGIWMIDDLPYGVYALLVHHDVDASGVMEHQRLAPAILPKRN